MEDLNIRSNTIPDWGKSKAVAFVYPYKIQAREHLKKFYDKLLAYIPEEIDIILLVKDLSFTDAYLQKCIKAGIKNKIDFFYFPDLFLRTCSCAKIRNGNFLIHLFQFIPQSFYFPESIIVCFIMNDIKQ